MAKGKYDFIQFNGQNYKVKIRLVNEEVDIKIPSGIVKELIITDTVPILNGKLNKKVSVLTVAGLFGEAIHRIHGGMSIGAMFDD